MKGGIFLLIVVIMLPAISSAQDFWQETNGPHCVGGVYSLAINSNGHIFAVADEGVYRSTDSGDNWIYVGPGEINVTSLAINSSGHIFIGTSSGVFRSTDNGAYWTETGLANTDVISFTIADSSGYIFAGTQDSGVFRSTDNGANWTLGYLQYSVTALIINSAGNIFAGTTDGVYCSTNNGADWGPVGLAETHVTSLAINSSGHIFAGTSYAVYRSTNSGANWSIAGLAETYVTSLAINSSGQIFAGTQDSGVFHSSDNGNNWTSINTGLNDNSVYSLAINSNGYIFAGSYGEVGGVVYRSTQSTNTVQITIATSPTGREVIVDSLAYIAPQTFQWSVGSQHTIGVSSPQPSGTTRYLYQGWSDEGGRSHTIITPDMNSTYTAYFTTQYYLAMEANPTIWGIVNPGSDWRDAGTNVQISAIADIGYNFIDWTGSGSGSYSGSNNPAMITMNGPIMETANFNISTVSITIATSPAGREVTVDSSTYMTPHVFQWSVGSQHQIGVSSPQPSGTTRYLYQSWSDGGGQGHTITTPSATTTYTANFTTQYYLTMNAGTGGTVSPASSWRNAGVVVAISATANTGYTFSSWTGSGSGSYSGTANSTTITMNGPITETANFTANPVHISAIIQTSPTGRSFTVDSTTYTTSQTFSWVSGSSHSIETTVTQVGETGTQYIWSGWSDGGALSHTVDPTSNVTYTANFTTQYYLTMNAGTGGTVRPASSWRNAGVVVAISATANSGYTFSSWTGSGSGSYSGGDNPGTITMNEPITETAKFDTSTVSITIATLPTGRNVFVDNQPYVAPHTFQWSIGSQHTIRVYSPQTIGKTRYEYLNWSDGGSPSHMITTPNTNTAYTANFTTQYYLTMGRNPTNGGSVSPGTVWWNAGTSVQISATTSSGYNFSSWTGSGNGSYSGSNNPATIIMNGAITETANFNEKVTANFSATPTFGFEPLTVLFSDLSSGEVVSWYWEFGDGGTSLLKEPTHIYSTYGLYNVSLRVTSQAAENQIIKQNYISVVKLNPPSSPQPGNPVQVTISIPANFNPTFCRLFYRIGGETEYNSLELPNSIPSDFVSVRGLEYYILMATGVDTIIYPNQEGKIHPQVIPVTIENYFPSELNLQSEKYDMISIPLVLGGDKQISVLLGDDYGEYDKTQWRVFYYLNPPGSYVEYSGMNFALEPGMGFWLITRGNSGFDVDGVSVNTGQVHSIELQPGANQIGNPFAFPVAWSRIENSDMVEIPQACIYYGTDNYEYMPSVTLEPWRGYFVLNQNQSAVTLRVPAVESYGNEATDLAWKQVKADEFVVQLKVQGMQSGKRDEQNFIGMLHAAKEGLDQIDFIEAPAIAAGLRLSIVDGTDRYSGNFTSISTSGVLWDIEVCNSGSSETGIFEIINSRQLPYNFKIWFYDEDHRELPPISEGKWMIELPGKGTTRDLKLLIGTDQYKEDQEKTIFNSPKEFVLYPNYPNPFNPSTTLRYQLTENGLVRLELFDMLGRKIKILINEYQNSGFHTTQWDGTDENRSAVPSGVYICRLVSQRQSLTKKIILIR